MPKSEKFQQLNAPWDRIFSLTTRVFVWALLAGVLYILRPFFLLIFLTFVFAYIQEHGVVGLRHRFKSRVYRVSIVFLVFLGVIIGTFYFLAPHVRNQMDEFTKNYPTYTAQADNAIYRYIDDKPALRKILLGENDEEEKKKKAAAAEEKRKAEGKTGEQGTEPKTPKAPASQEQVKPKKRPPILEPLLTSMLSHSKDASEPPAKPGAKNTTLNDSKEQLISAISYSLSITSSFLLSILFSFLIVFDLPKLSKGVRGLRHTKLGFIYEEVGENVHQFGKRLGVALEAQLFIALCNTVFTAIGIYFMGLPNIVFLASIVFFCSFIPVAGVFISSVPICLLALQEGGPEGGVKLMLIAIVFILVIHAIEAYILNPKIYGHHLHMNAVLVLIVLTIAGKIIGVWGLVLGLPVVNYIFGTAIRYKNEDGENITESGTAIPVIESPKP